MDGNGLVGGIDWERIDRELQARPKRPCYRCKRVVVWQRNGRGFVLFSCSKKQILFGIEAEYNKGVNMPVKCDLLREFGGVK